MRSSRFRGSIGLSLWLGAGLLSACASGGSTGPGSAAGTGRDGGTGDASAADSSMTNDATGNDSSGDDSTVPDSSDMESSTIVDEAGEDVVEPQESGTGGGGEDASGADSGAEASATTEAGSEAGSGTPEAGADASHVDSGGSCVPSSTTNYCSSLPPLAAAPVIDGVLDCGPTLVSMTPLGWNGTGSLPSGNSASIAVAWRPNGLYFFVAVVTPDVIPADSGNPPFYGSGVEVYVDDADPTSSSYPSPGAIQLVAKAPSGGSSVSVGEGYRDTNAIQAWAASEFATYPTSAGFNLEGFVSASDLGVSSWTLASGNQIGFDIAVDVSFTNTTSMSGQGHRAGQYFLSVGSGVGAPYTDPRSFCAPTLASQ